MTYSLASSDKRTERFTFSNSIWNIHLFFLYSFIKKLVGATSTPTNGIYFPLVGANDESGWTDCVVVGLMKKTGGLDAPWAVAACQQWE